MIIDRQLEITNLIKGDIGHVTNVHLVLTDCLCLGNDRVRDVTVSAPAYEGLPVVVHLTPVHLLTSLLTLVQNHFNK